MAERTGLRSTPVSQCLEKKVLFMGYELPDVLAIFMCLSALNLAFGRSNYKLALVWLPSVALALGLRLAKRGKPDGYLVHWVRFHVRPRFLFAFHLPTEPRPARRSKRKGAV